MCRAYRLPRVSGCFSIKNLYIGDPAARRGRAGLTQVQKGKDPPGSMSVATLSVCTLSMHFLFLMSGLCWQNLKQFLLLFCETFCFFWVLSEAPS